MAVEAVNEPGGYLINSWSDLTTTERFVFISAGDESRFIGLVMSAPSPSRTTWNWNDAAGCVPLLIQATRLLVAEDLVRV